MAPTRGIMVIYWATQVVAWTGYMFVLSLPAWLESGPVTRLVQVTLAMAVIGMVSSHVFRTCFLEWKWLEMPLLPLVLRMILGSMVLGALAGLLQAALHDAVFRDAAPLVGGNSRRLLEVLLSWMLQLFAWSVVYVAYHYVIRSRVEEMRSLRLAAANREGQLSVLRSQLNPHFMFNALNSIRALIEEDPERAKRSITLLSAILRNAMASVKRTTVPLGEEIDTVRSYLQLEAMRYEERLRVRFDVDPSLDRWPVPPMMLQTLVENAVRHGIARLPQGGEVAISVHPADHGMLIRVSNTGTLAEVPGREPGIGLRNTRQRLGHLYSSKAYLDIRNQEGTVVCEVFLPNLAEQAMHEIPEQHHSGT